MDAIETLKPVPLPKHVIFQGARIVDPSTGHDAVGDLGVSSGHVDEHFSGARRIDCRGLVLTPGLIDVHVHFRDPGGTVAEDLHSGARAAARGGFTRVVTMPNTLPPCDQPERVQRQIDSSLPVSILPAACISVGRQGRQVADLEALAAAGAVAFTDDGSTVADDEVMAAGMRLAARLGRPILDHAIDPDRAGEGMIRRSPLATALGLPVMSPEAEVAAVRRDIRLARAAGCAVHIQHVSCRESIERIRQARDEGQVVTAEVTPHHLMLAAEDIVNDDGNLRMNPPLGNREDLAALREAVCAGVVGILATDHAPHAPSTKARGFARATAGVIGLETAVGASWQALGREAGQKLLDFMACWTSAPARLLGLPPASLVRRGAPADFTLMDFETPWKVDPEQFLSRSRNCPFAGMWLHGRALLTVQAGRITWIDPQWNAQARLLEESAG